MEQPKCGQAEKVFFYYEPIACPKCDSPGDWWKEVFVAVRENHMRWYAFKALGAETKYAVVPASPGDIVEFDNVAAVSVHCPALLCSGRGLIWRVGFDSGG